MNMFCSWKQTLDNLHLMLYSFSQIGPKRCVNSPHRLTNPSEKWNEKCQGWQIHKKRLCTARHWSFSEKGRKWKWRRTLISFMVIVNFDLRLCSACSHSAIRALNACKHNSYDMITWWWYIISFYILERLQAHFFLSGRVIVCQLWSAKKILVYLFIVFLLALMDSRLERPQAKLTPMIIISNDDYIWYHFIFLNA